MFGQDTDLTRLDEPAIAALGIGRKFQKPTVFEPHTVWDNLLLSLAGDRRPRFTLWARETAEERERIERDPGHDPPDRAARPPRRRPVARPEAVAGDRHAAGAGAAAAAGRRAGGRHDRRGDRADRGAAARDQPHPQRRGGRARHGVRARARREGHGAARGLGAVGGLDRPCQRRSARHRSVSGATERMLEVDSTSICTTAPPSRCARCR